MHASRRLIISIAMALLVSVAPTLGGELKPVFEAAAASHDVSVDVLLTLGEMGSRFEDRGAEPTIEGGYGIMALRANDLGGESLALAASLTGVDVEALKTNADANILGAAAVLDAYARQAKIDRKPIEGWLPVIVRYAGLDEESSRIFAREFYERLQMGFSLTNAEGETFTMQPHQLSLDPASLTPPQIATAQPDYSGAIWDPTSCNHSNTVTSKDAVVIHTIEGTAAGAVSMMKNNCDAHVSAHYVVSESGTVWQLVPEAETAWHATVYNSRAVGIEHEGYASSSSHPESLYQASGTLVRDICTRRSIIKEKVRQAPGIVGHVDVTECVRDGTHTDPGRGWAFDHFVCIVNNIPERASFIVESGSGGQNNGNYSETGSWGNSIKSTTYGTTAGISSRYAYASGTNTATFRFVPPSAGRWRVYAAWPSSTNSVTQSEFQVTHAGGMTSIVVDQNANSNWCGRNNWNLLGEFTLYAGQTYTVTQTTENYHSSAVARNDAVKWLQYVVYTPPSIIQHPTSATVSWGEDVTLFVTATGDSPLTYKWQKNQVDISDGLHYVGTGTANLLIANATQAEAGSYRCVVTNAYGSTSSEEAAVVVVGTGFPPGDMDHDNDVDQADFGLFQTCFTAPGVAQDDPLCAEARLDADADVDHDDLGIFVGCYSGPGAEARMDCAE